MSKTDDVGTFEPQPDWTLISQGAEARIWKVSRDDDTHVIAKERFSKRYRHQKLDERLTKQRCRAEARILAKCKNSGGPPVPNVQPPRDA